MLSLSLRLLTLTDIASVIAFVELAERFSVRHSTTIRAQLLIVPRFLVLWFLGRLRAYPPDSSVSNRRLNCLQTNFIQQGLPPGSTTGAGGADDTAGALGLGQRAATGLNTFYQFWYCAQSSEKYSLISPNHQVLCDSPSWCIHCRHISGPL